VRAVKEKLTNPIQTDDGPIDEQISEIVWTASGKKAGIQPGEFRDFTLSVLIPGRAGQTLTFKALQTYSNGTVVRWIGAPGSDEPAPQLKLTSATTSASGSDTGARRQANSQGAPAPAAAASDDSNGLSIVALVLGALGLVVGAVALVVARRTASGGGARRP
jgi:uncharacterized protein